MKSAQLGRIVFGISAALFGVIALMWHDADTWQSLYRILRLPFGEIFGGALMIALIAGGVGISIPQTVRPASIVLCIVFAISSLVCVPAIVAHPAVFAAYDGFFEQFALLSGAVAIYAATAPGAARGTAFGRAARLGLALSTIAFTLAQVFYFKITADLVPAWIPPNQAFWAWLTTIAFALAAIALLVNVKARLAARLLTLMLALFGLLVWVPLVVTHSESHGNWSEFALNFLITGAAWMVAERGT